MLSVASGIGAFQMRFVCTAMKPRHKTIKTQRQIKYADSKQRAEVWIANLCTCDRNPHVSHKKRLTSKQNIKQPNTTPTVAADIKMTSLCSSLMTSALFPTSDWITESKWSTAWKKAVVLTTYGDTLRSDLLKFLLVVIQAADSCCSTRGKFQKSSGRLTDSSLGRSVTCCCQVNAGGDTNPCISWDGFQGFQCRRP